jgi:hypothetical protein
MATLPKKTRELFIEAADLRTGFVRMGTMPYSMQVRIDEAGFVQRYHDETEYLTQEGREYILAELAK